MSMHEIEYLVEDTVRRLDAGAPEHGLDLRTLFWNLYDYQSRFDTCITLFVNVTIVVRHRYLYPFPVEAHPDFERYLEYFTSLRDKTFEEIPRDPSKPWERETNRTTGYYRDPVRKWGVEGAAKRGWGALAKPQLYAQAGSDLWERWVANRRLTGADAVPPQRLDRLEFFHILMKEIIRQGDLQLAAEWYQMGMAYELGDPQGARLEELRNSPALLAIRTLAGEHNLHTVPVDYGFEVMKEEYGDEPPDTFWGWLQNPDD